MKDLFGEESIPPSEYYSQAQKDTWHKKFVGWCQEEYNKYSSLQGRFCCHCDWLCDMCLMEKLCGCEDCAETIINILEENNILIDYNDYDFEKWENLAKQYERVYSQTNVKRTLV